MIAGSMRVSAGTVRSHVVLITDKVHVCVSWLAMLASTLAGIISRAFRVHMRKFLKRSTALHSINHVDRRKGAMRTDGQPRPISVLASAGLSRCQASTSAPLNLQCYMTKFSTSVPLKRRIMRRACFAALIFLTYTSRIKFAEWNHQVVTSSHCTPSANRG